MLCYTVMYMQNYKMIIQFRPFRFNQPNLELLRNRRLRNGRQERYKSCIYNKKSRCPGKFWAAGLFSETSHRTARRPIMGGPFLFQAFFAAMRLASAAAALWTRLRRRMSLLLARVGHTRFVSSTRFSPVSGSMAMLVPVKPVWP